MTFILRIKIKIADKLKNQTLFYQFFGVFDKLEMRLVLKENKGKYNAS